VDSSSSLSFHPCRPLSTNQRASQVAFQEDWVPFRRLQKSSICDECVSPRSVCAFSVFVCVSRQGGSKAAWLMPRRRDYPGGMAVPGWLSIGISLAGLFGWPDGDDLGRQMLPHSFPPHFPEARGTKDSLHKDVPEAKCGMEGGGPGCLGSIQRTPGGERGEGAKAWREAG
jgi:hypothetical protein